MNTPFTRSATRSLRNAVGKAIVHISEQRTRIEELQHLVKEGFIELEEKEARITHLAHLYSNGLYDLEQAELLLKDANNKIKDLRDRLRHGPELTGWDG